VESLRMRMVQAWMARSKLCEIQERDGDLP
jgi:hypothetical protein